VAQAPEEPLDGLDEEVLEEPVAEVAPDEEVVEPDVPPDTDELLEEMEEDLYPPPVEGTGIRSYGIREFRTHKPGQRPRRGPGVDEGLERILGSGKLCKTVSTMRRTGLEVVIAFDSTGSMNNVIDQATLKIDEMISVLQALVPQVRVGLVTYRDHGEEEYVTRECPMTASRYRLKDFIESVEAAGGQDIPEAVADGLAVAFNKMKWSRSSHRFVVLIGDAPPHKRDRSRIARLIRKFVQGGSNSSVVSTIITGSSFDTDEETVHAFRDIAKKGKGVCVSLNREEKVLREIIRIVFGRQFERTLDDIRSYIADKQRLGEQERDWILHANIDAMIEEGLIPHGRRKISPEVVENLIRMGMSEVKRSEIFEKLTALLMRRDLPEETLWAGRYILKKLTHGRVLLDPEASFLMRKQQLQRIRLR
jgi:Mg-chelatase subunit ChlD